MTLMAVSRDQILACLGSVAQVFADNMDYLTDLDAAIGDADHGINMQRGFAAVKTKLAEVQDKDIGTIFKAVGMALVSTVGGAAGPLYGTFFLRAGQAAGQTQELTQPEFTTVIDAGVRGVMERGKAKVGEKTMVDALQPTLDALRDALAQGRAFEEALRMAAAAAESGMKATVPLKATKGRASYLGERSIGHQDPGATSSYLIFRTLAECLAP